MGLCELTAPEIVEVGDDGQAIPAGAITSANLSLVEEAVANCPTSALALLK
jgi:ferredoxin